MTEQPLPTTEQDQIRKLKRALIMSLIVIVFIGGMLAYNMQKIKDYRTISAGNYLTEQECKTLNGFYDLGINITSTPTPINTTPNSNG
jgi:hypothetical protein